MKKIPEFYVVIILKFKSALNKNIQLKAKVHISKPWLRLSETQGSEAFRGLPKQK